MRIEKSSVHVKVEHNSLTIMQSSEHFLRHSGLTMPEKMNLMILSNQTNSIQKDVTDGHILMNITIRLVLPNLTGSAIKINASKTYR